MRVRFLTAMSVRGHAVQAGEVFDVPEGDLWRLAGRFEPVTESALPADPEEVEERDPAPGHRDPKHRSKK